MIGILTEKPSAGRNFGKALGGMSGSYNGEQYTIVSARGHLYEFVQPEDQVPAGLKSAYKNWAIENLPWKETDFSWKRERKSDVKASDIKAIKDVLSKCDEVVIATDVDPTGEGELLAWEILDAIGIRPKKWSRMFFTDEAPASLQKSFTSRKQLAGMLQDPDYLKALYRSQWDFLSMQWTRIATKFGDGKSVLRQGRLKSAMVLIVGDGLAAYNGYKKVPFYSNKFRDENGVLYSNPNEPVFKTKGEVPQNYTQSPVTVDSKDMKATAPPKFYDLAGLSSKLSGKGVKAKEVLETYQKMYEAQVVSYPRTEDKIITPEQFNELLPHIDAIAKVVGVKTTLLTHRTPRKTHVKTGGAHGANRPGLNVPTSLSALAAYGKCAADIYELLALNYLATLCEDYEYEQQKGHLSKYKDFKGISNVPKKLGWKEIFTDDSHDSDEDDSGKGLGTIADPFIHEGFPPKPPQPSMSWLMKQLEKYDVGTGATRTSTYADVTNDKSKAPLLVEKKGKLTMAPCGDMSYRLLPGTHIGSLTMTEKVMAEMKEVADGKLNSDEGLARIRQMIVDDIEVMKNNSVGMRKELGINMAETEKKEKYNGVWAKTGDNVSFSRVWRGYRFSDTECLDLLDGKEIEVNGIISPKTGQPYGVKGVLAEQSFKGDSGMIKFIGFKDTGFLSSGGGIPAQWSGHTITDAEKAKLEAGEEVEFKDCVSKKTGKKFSCVARFGEENGQKKIIPTFG